MKKQQNTLTKQLTNSILSVQNCRFYQAALNSFAKRTLIIALCGVYLLSTTIIPAIADESTSDSPNSEEKWLRLSILQVHCLDETSNEVPEWFGEDDMSLGGTAVSRYGVDKIDHRSLGDFDDDTIRTYADWIFTEIPLEEVTAYSRILFSLVERDPGGGKEEHLEQLAGLEYTDTKSELIAHFLAELERGNGQIESASSDAATDFTFLTLFSFALKLAATEVASRVVNDYWDALILAFDDDFFPPQYLDAPAITDSNTKIVNTQQFYGFRGAYEVTYQWELITKSTATDPVESYQPDYPFSDTTQTLLDAWNNKMANRLIYLPIIQN